jgi:hypothetical protein
VFSIQPAEHTKSQSMESRVLAVLDSFPTIRTQSSLETMEHLALVKRWYYRGRRAGEIFLADDKGVFPMRRIVRGIGRVLRGEGPEEAGAVRDLLTPEAPFDGAQGRLRHRKSQSL